MTRALVTYDAACAAIAAAKTVDVAKKLRDKHEAMRVLAHQAGNVQVEIDHAELRVRATRQLGALLIAAKKAGQVRSGRPRTPDPCEMPVGEPGRVTLEDAGVSRKLSMQAQRLAGLAAPTFEAQLAELCETMATRSARVSLDIAGKVAKTAKLDARRADYKSRQLLGCTRADLEKLSAAGARFGVIYADPNWEYRTWSDKGSGRSADQHYDTAPDDDLLAYGPLIESLACADGAVLLLWAIGPQLPLALDLIRAAKFKYQTIGFAWPKLYPTVDAGGAFTIADFFMGNGHWTRANIEICLLATRGHPSRLAADVRQIVVAPRGEHSEKPKIHDRIERLAAGPYLELFARAPVDGWTCWGDEIPRGDFVAATNGGASASSLPGLTRQSMGRRGSMDGRVKPGHDASKKRRAPSKQTPPLPDGRPLSPDKRPAHPGKKYWSKKRALQARPRAKAKKQVRR